MNKADKQNLTYRRILMVSKTNDNLSLSRKNRTVSITLYLSRSTEEKQFMKS